MGEFDVTKTLAVLGGGVGVLITLGIAVRDYLDKKRLTDVSRDSTIGGIEANDTVLNNLVAEVARLSTRITDLESKVEHLTDKLANVRLKALDCYQIVSSCSCGGANRDILLELLKSIIRDA